jgi:hypothetical protein
MLMTVLLILVVFGLLLVAYWAAHRMADAAGAPPMVMAVFDVALVVVFVFYVLEATGLLGRILR